jgi:lipid-A-disaccharide synthase
VNLLADAEVMPEYLTDHDESANLARWALTWLNDPAARERASAALRALRDRVAQPGASERAAARIADVVLKAAKRSAYPNMHIDFHNDGGRENIERRSPDLDTILND